MSIILIIFLCVVIAVVLTVVALSAVALWLAIISPASKAGPGCYAPERRE